MGIMNTSIELVSTDIAEQLCRRITLDLPEYFGLPECNEQYARAVRTKTNFVLSENNDSIGLLSLDFPYPHNANIYWMGILKAHHGRGYGRLLIESAIQHARIHGAKTMTVETLAPDESDENYLRTYRFYEGLGFTPLFNLKPNGYEWNMVYMCLVLA